MKYIKFEGASENTFVCDGRGVGMECETNGDGKTVWLRVSAERESFLVFARYDGRPALGWAVGVAQVRGTDGRPQLIPEWEMSIERGDTNDSPSLHVEAPDDVQVVRVDDRGRVIG